MSYVYAALVLQAMGKEIDEANLKRILVSMSLPAEDAEIEALLALMNRCKEGHRSTQGLELLEREVRVLDKRLAAIEEWAAGMRGSPAPPEAQPAAPPTELAAIPETEARYLYCIADGAEGVVFGKIGIEDNLVYTIPYRDLSAVVHNCPTEPYNSGDNELVKRWIMAHQRVVETAQERFGTVLPLSFDTIIKGDENGSPEDNMGGWLRDEYENFREKMDKVRGKDEYVVQIFWDLKVIANHITRTSEEIRRLDEEMRYKPKGTAYMYKQKLESAIKNKVEMLADEYFKDFYHRIKQYADDVRVEKVKKAEEDKQMLANLSCLVSKANYEGLGEELDKILQIEGVSVRFTGPWPPYSFVSPG